MERAPEPELEQSVFESQAPERELEHSVFESQAPEPELEPSQNPAGSEALFDIYILATAATRIIF